MKFSKTDTELTFDCGCTFPVVKGRLKVCLDKHSKDFNVNLDCEATYELLGNGYTEGIFQLTTQLGRSFTKRLKPENIQHIAALGAILRPSCLDSRDTDGVSMTTHYVKRKNGEEEVPKFHPVVDAILDSTYGIMPYQEQSMEIVKQCANFNLQEADILRRGIGHKEVATVARCKTLFIEKAKEAGILSEEQALQIFNQIEASQRYQFNRCVSADTVIDGKRPLTVEEMHRRGNYGKSFSLCEDGRIRLNTIENIQFAGYHPVFRVTLQNGLSIDATSNHKFPTDRGEVLLENLTFNDSLYCKGKRDKKGYTNTLSRIIKSDYVGMRKTYDVTMAAPNHNFSVNGGIITCNSHSISYGILGYINAYVKQHFPIQYYKSWLKIENDRAEYSKLINEAKLFGIFVRPPDIRHLKTDFYNIYNDIYFGLYNIKGVRKNDLDILGEIFTYADINPMKLGSSVGWMQFLAQVLERVSSTTAERLIYSGACDCFGMDREAMWVEYERWNELTDREKKAFSDPQQMPTLRDVLYSILSSEQIKLEEKISEYNQAVEKRSKKNYKKEPKPLVEPHPNKTLLKAQRLIQLIDNPVYNIEDTIDSTMFHEEDLLGVSLTKHPTGAVKECVETRSCMEIANGCKEYSVLKVKLDRVGLHRCKSGDNAGDYMAFLEISDKSFRLENVVAFPQVYKEFEQYLVTGNIVYVSGQLDKDSFIIKRVYPLA